MFARTCKVLIMNLRSAGSSRAHFSEYHRHGSAISEGEFSGNSYETTEKNPGVGTCVDGESNNPRKQLPRIWDFLLVHVVRRQMEASRKRVKLPSSLHSYKYRCATPGGKAGLKLYAAQFRALVFPNELSEAEASECRRLNNSNTSSIIAPRF